MMHDQKNIKFYLRTYVLPSSTYLPTYLSDVNNVTVTLCRLALGRLVFNS